jgi:hypothetical protein
MASSTVISSPASQAAMWLCQFGTAFNVSKQEGDGAGGETIHLSLPKHTGWLHPLSSYLHGSNLLALRFPSSRVATARESHNPRAGGTEGNQPSNASIIASSIVIALPSVENFSNSVLFNLEWMIAKSFSTEACSGDGR